MSPMKKDGPVFHDLFVARNHPLLCIGVICG